MLAELVERAACVAAFGDWQNPICKHADDLTRYARIIEATRPEVVVECGTRGGHSARWFAEQGCEVITVDIDPAGGMAGTRMWQSASKPTVHHIIGDSADPDTVGEVRALLDRLMAQRVMVSLDSDHSEDHVRREVELYREMVSPGCYLVVEDGVIDWLPSPKPHGCDVYTGSVLAAIEDTLGLDDRFLRDGIVEAMLPVTMFPAGWWVRRG